MQIAWRTWAGTERRTGVNQVTKLFHVKQLRKQFGGESKKIGRTAFWSVSKWQLSDFSMD